MKIISLFCALMMFATFISAEPIAVSDQQAKDKSKVIIKAVTDAYNNNNYARVAVYFDEVMFEDFPQAKFSETRGEVFPLYGPLESVEYLGYLTQLGDTMVLYKGWFEKSQGLIKLVLSQAEDKVIITGLWFE